MNLWKSLEGMAEVRVISADLSAVLDALGKQGVAVDRVRFEDPLTAVLTFGRRGLSKLEMILNKRGESFRILRRKGIYWRIMQMTRRPILTVGLILILLAVLYLPTRIFFLQVEGNSTLSDRQILAAAEECGIRFGASRREVRSEKVKNALLQELPQLKWAGVNTAGCVATVSVRERTQNEILEPENEVSSLVAARDGIILSCTVTEGNARCMVGQAVRQGQILISGYTDCGILLKATRAEGEILAQTRRKVLAVTLPEKIIRAEEREVTENYSLIIGKKRINLCNSSRNCAGACGRMYEEYYITLPGGFVLPVALAVDRHICYGSATSEKSSEEVYEALKRFCESYVRGQMISGTVVDASLSAETGNGSCRLEADYLCVEMIGVRRQERKVETNGKSG